MVIKHSFLSQECPEENSKTWHKVSHLRKNNYLMRKNTEHFNVSLKMIFYGTFPGKSVGKTEMSF